MGIPVRERRQRLNEGPVSKPTKAEGPAASPPAAPAQLVVIVGGLEAIDAARLTRLRLKPGESGKPIARPKDHPEIPMTRADMPQGVSPLLGVLAWRKGNCRRPFIFLRAFCPGCGEALLLPWRGDWALDPEIASLMAVPCRNRIATYAVSLNPTRLPESTEQYRQAAEQFIVWRAKRREMQAARKAARIAKRAEALATPAPDTAPALRPFSQPPVGTPSRGAMP